MSVRVRHFAIIGMALLLGGCSYADDLFGTNWSGERASPTTAATGQGSSSASSSQAPATSPSTRRPMATAPTGTIVGEQAQRLGIDLSRLKSNVPQRQQEVAAASASAKRDWQAYVDMATHLASHVKSGTTPGNPNLMAQWAQAQSSLNHLIGDIDQLSRLSNQVAEDISFATYLTKTANNAFSLQGAIDEDHRQLTEIKKELDGTSAELNALLKTVTDEITQQSENVTNGTDNLTTIAQAIRTGTLSASTRVASTTRMHHAANGREPSTNVARPFVVINFKSTHPKYADALYTAISRALDRDPAAKFNLVAVSPAAGTADQIALYSKAAKENAEGVMRSLLKMGLPADRLTLSATTSSEVQTNEVRIYVH
jgi:hypothetical protein